MSTSAKKEGKSYAGIRWFARGLAILATLASLPMAIDLYGAHAGSLWRVLVVSIPIAFVAGVAVSFWRVGLGGLVQLALPVVHFILLTTKYDSIRRSGHAVQPSHMLTLVLVGLLLGPSLLAGIGLIVSWASSRARRGRRGRSPRLAPRSQASKEQPGLLGDDESTWGIPYREQRLIHTIRFSLDPDQRAAALSKLKRLNRVEQL